MLSTISLTRAHIFTNTPISLIDSMHTGDLVLTFTTMAGRGRAMLRDLKVAAQTASSIARFGDTLLPYAVASAIIYPRYRQWTV